MVLAAPVLAQVKNWATTVSVTPKGGVLIGNPAAAVKLVEFGSLTCSHCGAFHRFGLPGLKERYLAGGKVSYEFRSFVRNGPDFTASLLAGCLAAGPQMTLLDALFDEQERWLTPFTQVPPDAMAALGALPPEQQFVKLAALGGLDKWAVAKGMAPEKVRACLSDEAAMDRLAATRTEAVDRYGLEGTPTFVLNGTTVPDVFEWATLEPKLAAAVE
jgi:protein-disulfide isomerase